MKVAILAGGKGSRLSELTESIPKPLIRIGGQPIICHIMNHYASFGFSDFVIALGYKGDMFKEYFNAHSNNNWNVELVDTGEDVETGGRIKRLEPTLGNARFMLTWGDGLSDIDIGALIRCHEAEKRLATLTAVHPPGRFGHLTLDGARVTEFREKDSAREGWINGAFFVLEPKIFDYIEGDATRWELGPINSLAHDGQLTAYKHEGFWQCMDTLHEKRQLEELVASDIAPWMHLEDHKK